jgi:hypothetical protein
MSNEAAKKVAKATLIGLAVAARHGEQALTGLYPPSPQNLEATAWQAANPSCIVTPPPSRTRGTTARQERLTMDG